MNIQLSEIKDDIRRAVQIALEEDIGSGDITAQLIPEDQEDSAEIITREDCVLCGQAWLDEVYRQLGDIKRIDWQAMDGDKVPANTTLVTLRGNTRNLLTGERVALNFLQLLSGTATKARQYADLVEGSSIKILDTRKTIPGLRTAQKYAVSVGGCYNHRVGLFDAFLIKENHIRACGSIKNAIHQARTALPEALVEVEVTNLDELHQALRYSADRIMLDNFSEEDFNYALAQPRGSIEMEKSGNIVFNDIAKLAKKGLDYVSVGALSKNVGAIDLSFTLV